jgi:hypothetical protein
MEFPDNYILQTDYFAFIPGFPLGLSLSGKTPVTIIFKLLLLYYHHYHHITIIILCWWLNPGPSAG